ncbi:unknown [Clostridium sp. CAG:524]|nr:unknown [Clostridium sp. CAG:524]
MKKEKKFLNDLENKLSGISKKDRNKIIEKYRNIIHEEKSNNRRIVDILKELGSTDLVAEKEIQSLKSNGKIKIFFNNVKEFITKDIQFTKKEKKEKPKKEKIKKEKIKKEKKNKVRKEKVKRENIFKVLKSKFNFKKKDKDTLKENIIETKEEVKEELPNIVESITEKKIFESKDKRIRRIVFRTLGTLLIICLLFIWLWVTVLLMSSMFAILDGIKYYGFNIALFGVDLLLLIIVILVNKLIIGKKISIKWTLISVILTLIIIACGISLFMKQISKIDIVKDVSDKYTMTRKYEKISLPSNLDKITRISFNSHYDTKYTIEYDNTLDNKITIETKYYESYYDYYMKKNVNDIYVSLSLDYRDRLSVYLENLKENKIYDKNELSRYTVKITMNERDKDRVIIEN